MAGKNGESCVEDLLAQQLELIQKALSFNQRITDRLNQDGKSQVQVALPTSDAVPKIAKPKVTVTSDLEEPLLASQSLSCPVPKHLMHSATFQSGAVAPEATSVKRKGGGLGRFDSEDSDAGMKKKEKKQLVAPNTRGMFPTPEDIKARVVETLTTPEYNVEDLYKTVGSCQKLARSQAFGNTALLVIGLNTLWIAYETDNNKADVLCNAATQFIIIDNLFCLFFAFEISVRFLSFQRKVDALTDRWFCFDSVLVALMVWETWIVVALYELGALGVSGGAGHTSLMRILRLFRLTRVARMARLLRSMPELMVLVKGMVMAIRSVGATLLLLIFIIYVFAVMFTQLLSNKTELCFTTVPSSMNCLLMHGVFSEEAEFIGSLLEVDWTYYLLILAYLLFASLTVMNMLIGVLCEVVSVVAKCEQEENQMKQLKWKITTMMEHLDVQGQEYVTHANFKQIVESTEAMQSLHHLGLDVVALVGYADFIFRDSDRVPLNSFVETVLQFRGSNTATVKDVVDMRKFLSNELCQLETRILKSKTV